MKFSSLKAGMKAFTVSRQKMGNTTMYTVAVHPVYVVSCDSETETVMARWNGNEPRKFYERQYKTWRASEPMLVKSGWGHRLATREEIAAAKAAAKGEQQ